MALATVLKTLVRFVPISVTAVTITAAIRATISPYSTAVAPGQPLREEACHGHEVVEHFGSPYQTFAERVRLDGTAPSRSSNDGGHGPIRGTSQSARKIG